VRTTSFFRHVRDFGYASGVKFRPTVSKEQYTLNAVQRAWPSGEWVTSVELVASEKGESPAMQHEGGVNGGDEAPSSLTIIGGTKYDEDLLSQHVFGDSADTLIVGVGRGAEAFVLEKMGAECIPLDPDRYGKSARKVNVEQVLCADPDSPLLLVGSGERVKQAKDWLRRTRSKREVIELP
jgi:hypothetical protein